MTLRLHLNPALGKDATHQVLKSTRLLEEAAYSAEIFRDRQVEMQNLWERIQCRQTVNRPLEITPRWKLKTLISHSLEIVRR